ncbi:histidine kinase [Alkalimonas sp.]|uniref:sensor histidine kinase n=1 Tax=Alkalimonas sp. TaxID=1872453 RepID=UPI00263A9DA7|nr:histidine kinase [Alkalimonas sp.]MCC5827480.1 histidine kinase [Alkalimonas sp.]
MKTIAIQQPIKQLRQRLRLLGPTDMLVIALLSTSCAVLSALHQQVYQPTISLSYLLASFTEYAKVFNLIGFCLVFIYLLLMPAPSQSVSFCRMAAIGTLTFFLSWVLSMLLFPWDKTLLPPLWEAATYLLRILLSSVWVIFVLLYLKNRFTQPQFQQLQQQIHETAQQRDQAEMELHLLQAQLEPHFFFNTLANMHNLIDLDPEKAKLLLEELTSYLRASIPQFRQPFIPLAEEVNIIERYLAIQQIRFGNRLEYQLDISPDAAKAMVLPMSVLTLVENAIKHGIEKVTGTGKIQMSARIAQQQLQIEVSDSAAQPLQSQQGTGLNNLQARLLAAYGQAGHFSIRVQPGQCTIAQLGVPLHG